MLKKIGKRSVAAVVLGTVLVATGCGSNSVQTSSSSSASNGNKVLNIGIQADPPSLDPMTSSALVDRMVQNSIYDKLFDLDKDGKIVPMLATSYETTDGKIYIIKLRTGIKFQDGTDFNADAVKFNLERDMSKGSKRTGELAMVQSVSVVDPSTVRIVLKKPFAPFISILADRSGMMASPAAVKKYGSDYQNHPVGTGPFVFVEHLKGDHVTLKRNDTYWNGKPKLSEVVFKVFADGSAAVQNLKSGMLDIVGPNVIPVREIPTIKSDPNLSLVADAGMAFQGFYMNETIAPFNNQYLREAVDHAIDRNTIVKVLFNGYGAPAYSPFGPGDLAYGSSDKAPAPNDGEIKDLLAKGGKPNGFSFTLEIPTTTIGEQFGTVIQGMLKKYGINMKLEKTEFGTLISNGNDGKFQALQLGWSGRPDPDQNIYDFVVTGQPENNARISDPKLDKLLNQARVELDNGKRKQLYDQAMVELHNNAGYTYIYHEYNIFGISKKINGFTYVPDGIVRTAAIGKN
ncbi:ABC transporter substrate-binding protein [Fodinisporobacter ferrooxydans]|uniref:ABC transporter substrate-binding protein n=1 Tax=Fodinisporobacter ferrooxydans TaxID=2901836 RepID=A0ABY4CJU3_9BACL|nr:ABC transporter substrate-binding protein [Alicyclobacillaceae bacterium MYW30-H2]